MSSSFLTTLKVGITTILALIILFAGVFWVKNYNPAEKKIRITVMFDNGKGIYNGDSATISGIKIGEVTRVSLSENKKALIEFYIKYVKLSPDTAFEINDVGLMGDKVLVIIPGEEDGELDPDVIHKGRESSDLKSLVAKAGNVLQKLDRISDKLDNDLDIAKIETEFENTFDKIQEAVDIYKELALENKEPLKKSLANLDASTSGLKTFIEKNDNKLEQAIESFLQTTDKLSLFIDDMQTFSALVDTVAEYMNSGDGTLGNLIKSDDLYEELRHTNAAIDSFISDFKRNPGKYTKDMKFKLRLF